MCDLDERHYVYILYSPRLGRFYTGMSRFRGKRLRQHLRNQSGWTSRSDDWYVAWSTAVSDARSARDLEKRIKSRGAGRFRAAAWGVPNRSG